MAGANYEGGTDAIETSVPTMGSLSGEAKVAGVVADPGVRAEGVSYNTNESIGTDVTTKPYPSGTVMSDSTPGDHVN